MRTNPLAAWLCALLILAPAAAGFAHPTGPSAPYSLSVEDESGRPLRTFHRGGETYVLGEYGTRYQIRVHNRTGRRIEAVLSVDGRDVVSGGAGDFVSQRGYVIGAYDSVVVEGFRQNLDQVATFRFTNPGNSYSSRMGTPENVGVIGVAIFPERKAPRPPALARPRTEYRPHGPGDYRSRDAELGRSAPSGASADKAPRAEAPPAASPRSSRGYAGESESNQGAAEDSSGGYGSYAEAAPKRNNLGTEYGESRDSQVREVGFRRENSRSPAQVIALRYDDARGLMARGFELHPRPVVVQREPEAFPVNRFAAPPPAY